MNRKTGVSLHTTGSKSQNAFLLIIKMDNEVFEGDVFLTGPVSERSVFVNESLCSVCQGSLLPSLCNCI